MESRVLRTEGENAAAPAISRTRDVNSLSLRKSREGDGETRGEPSNGFAMAAPFSHFCHASALSAKPVRFSETPFGNTEQGCSFTRKV